VYIQKVPIAITDRSINVTEFRAKLREMLAAVGSGAIRRLTVTRDGRPLVTVTPAEDSSAGSNAVDWLLNGPRLPNGREDALDRLKRPKLKPRSTGL
jgi:prevent-host-death family protein